MYPLCLILTQGLALLSAVRGITVPVSSDTDLRSSITAAVDPTKVSSALPELSTSSPLIALALSPPPIEPEGTIVSPQFVGCTSAERFERLFDNITGENDGDISLQRNQRACASHCVRVADNIAPFWYTGASYRKRDRKCYCSERLFTPLADALVEGTDSRGGCKRHDAVSFNIFSHYDFDRCYDSIVSSPPATNEVFLAFDHTACEQGCYYTTPRGQYNVVTVNPFFDPNSGFTIVNCTCYTGDAGYTKGRGRTVCDDRSVYRYVRKVRRGHDEGCE
ncbi:hypothetical protein I317_07966 [Kwoniella heveanensis CBS 569]|nr:hypothetical protein I317_07966 [Kwoniella heveanensis CBS 569]